MNMKNNEALDMPARLHTFKEAMHYLHVSRSTLYRLIGRGELLGRKVGSQWRFRQEDLNDIPHSA